MGFWLCIFFIFKDSNYKLFNFRIYQFEMILYFYFTFYISPFLIKNYYYLILQIIFIP